MSMLHHLSFAVADFAQAVAFYDAALAPLGYVRVWTEESGAGRTINMSSTGVLFTTDQMLLPGRRIEVSISWPAQLNNKCALRLVARGRVVRFDDGKAAMEIQQYEFKTQAKAPLVPIQ